MVISVAIDEEVVDLYNIGWDLLDGNFEDKEGEADSVESEDDGVEEDKRLEFDESELDSEDETECESDRTEHDQIGLSGTELEIEDGLTEGNE